MKPWKTIPLLLFSFILLISLAPTRPAQARQGFGVGIQGLGNFFLTDSIPNLKIGPGGGIWFDYRFNQRWAIETDLNFSIHNGKGVSTGDNNMWLLGVPTIQLKFYLVGRETRIDPYLLAGVGVFVLTEGSVSNNSGGVGMGGLFGIGSDFWVTDWMTLGLVAKFRPIAIIQGNSRSAGLINFSMQGNIAWHFGGGGE